MPKLKTRSAAKKRFNFTGSGTTILKKSDFQTIRDYLPYNN